MKKTTSALSTCFVDTNIFLCTLIREDERVHRSCVAFLEQVREGNIHAVTSPLVLAEIVWTLKSVYMLTKREIVVAAESVRNIRHLRIEARERVDNALALYAEHNIKFVDALIASIPSVRGGTVAVVSFDHDFDRIPNVVRIEPAEVLSRLR